MFIYTGTPPILAIHGVAVYPDPVWSPGMQSSGFVRALPNLESLTQSSK